MMRIATILFVIISISSCKKDRLKDDKEIFIGKWKWVQTKILNNTCGGGPEYYNYKDPNSEGINYSIEFLECGKLIYYENGESKSKDRIVFEQFEVANQINWPGYYYEFLIAGDNKDEKQIGGLIKSDTLILAGYGWPNLYSCDCCRIKAYFVRE